MLNQSEIQAAIQDGSYRLGTLANTNLNLVLNGGLAIKGRFINWFNLNLQGLIYQYETQDYNSTITLTLYDRVIGFTGLPSDVTVDPNFQNPAIIINVTEIGAEVDTYTYNQDDLIDASPPDGGVWYLPFETPDGQSLSGKTPIMVAINGTSFTFQFDNLTQRIYGFANNDTQTITVTVI